MKTLFTFIVIITLLNFQFIQNATHNEFAKKLLFQYDEEKFAHDYYNAMYDQWKILAFKNLAKCEESHMKVVKGLIAEFGDIKAIEELQPGVFTNPELTRTFKEKMQTARESENDALIAAANFEEKNISNLEDLIKMPEGQANQECMENLLDSSIDHLNLLVCHLRHRAVEYRPVQLSVAKYIKCVGNQYADLTKASEKCLLEEAEDECPFRQEQ